MHCYSCYATLFDAVALLNSQLIGASNTLLFLCVVFIHTYTYKKTPTLNYIWRELQQLTFRMIPSGLPHFACGEIIKGFGRGSKQLGIPTANYSEEVVNSLPKTISTGIYFGWAQVQNQIHKMVISIGWNPYYDNERKSMETHIMHKFDEDLYGQTLKIVIVGYLRPETNFDSLEALITAINNDIKQADKLLDNEEFAKFKNHDYFK